MYGNGHMNNNSLKMNTASTGHIWFFFGWYVLSSLDRSAWRLAISVPEPWPLCLLGFISSPPQLVWDKRLCCCCCSMLLWTSWTLGIICAHHSKLLVNILLPFSCTGWLSEVCSSLRSLITSRLGNCRTQHYGPDVLLSIIQCWMHLLEHCTCT